jgi:hypothetical protein
MANRTINQRHRFIDIKRFGQIIKGALLIGADRGVQIECAVIMMTGSIGWRCLICFSSASPSIPGMRISDSSTSGVLVVRASSTSLPLSNVVQLKPAPVSARSSTQRMELSSSTIQLSLVA